MTEEPTMRSAEPESAAHGLESNPPPAADSARSTWAARVTARLPAATRPTRSLRKKILVPAVLTVIGLAILLAGYRMYPRRAQPAPPIYASVKISGTGIPAHAVPPISFIEYTVLQGRPDEAGVEVGIQSARLAPPGTKAQITLYAGGAKIMTCSPSCSISSGSGVAVVNLRSQTAAPPGAYFLVRAHSFGVAANGVTASAAFPLIAFTGARQQPILIINYPIPGAKTYDWSSNPTISLSKSDASWEEPVIPRSGQQVPGAIGLTPTRIATGINHTAETKDNTLTLVAGVLFGLGGGALVAAVQEALHD